MLAVESGIWTSSEARALVEQHHPGGLVRMGRRHRGWRQTDLGDRIGCSASTVSRLEGSKRVTDMALLRTAAAAVGCPSPLLAAACGFATAAVSARTRVAQDAQRDEEDPMRRRTLLAAAGSAVPATLLLAVDDALAGTPAPSGKTAPLDARLAHARSRFDAGQHTDLLRDLPGLLGDAHHVAQTRADLDHARLSACYTLASQVLVKIGRHDRARITADRAVTYAALSGSALAAAAAARELAIVLRHQDQPAAAQRLMLSAAAEIEATGLRTEAQASAYAQMLCTTSYTAARAGDRGQALAMIAEARLAARRLPANPPAGRLLRISPAAVDLYAVGVHWALGDAGAALDAGCGLRADLFPTAERKSRMHTDLARAWWQWGKPEQTARELLAAMRVSPGEVRDRPAIRSIVSELSSRHPRTPGVRELTLAVAR
ncbi:helix-turn-helix domain-containing protein [Streptomyces sp. SID8381]|uniref:helix-turn-helix domain-containing protein n=1 Tax=unclassified Streptomyces TaxID=2593676 RepID=UPI00037F0511|nr:MULTISPECIES: helix-turn-helix transcriptional regulator [unclassified Streptomyces]MYX26781.1 helix-turn-helix domain-containing protein [Streptomyces sp. SID8381]